MTRSINHNDLYDRLTIEECLRMEQVFKESLAKISEDDPEHEEAVASYEIVRHISLLTIKGHNADKKEQFLQKWQERDQLQEKLLESAQPQKNIKCLTCHEFLNFDFKTSWSGMNEQERVLLFYSCPNNCLPNRAYFNDGEEYIPEPTLCTKCKGSTTRESKRNANIVTTFWLCKVCGHEDIDEYDFNRKEKEENPIDENLRKEYCMDEKELESYRQMKRDMEGFSAFMEKSKAQHEDTKTNKRMESLRRLRVTGLQERLIKVLEKVGMMKVELSNPTNDRGLKVRITMLDSQQNRSDQESKKVVKKVLVTSLHNTNWRLIHSSLESILGAVSGELHGYTSDDEIRKIIEKENATNLKTK